MFKKIGNRFDKHPVLGKVIICAAWSPNDDFETHEGELADNFQKVQEFIQSLKMIPGEEFYIECDDLNREHISKIFLSQMYLGDEINFADF